MPLTPKENYLAVLTHGTPDRHAVHVFDTIACGFGAFAGPWFEKGPGIDGFGVNWVTPESGARASIPEPGKFLLDSETIVDWKKIVKFPDVCAFDWETQAKQDLSIGNPNEQLIDFGSGNGPFERMAALMGFEEALLAMALEPEACFDLCDAIADYKIQIAEMVKKYYNADVFTNYDDIATERGLFMSPETYRAIIKPAHKKMNDAVKSLGMMPIQHTCGKADSLVEDYIETGAVAWTSVQSTNDIVDILKKYGDKFCIIGGYNTTGEPGRAEASPEVVRAEVDRCFAEYGFSKSFAFFGLQLVNTPDPMDFVKALMPMMQYAMECSVKLSMK